MRRLDLTLKAEQPFEVPAQEGYQLYSALLALLKESNPSVSQAVHDSTVTSISLGRLNGSFRRSERIHHKQVIPEQSYSLRIGITDPHDDEIFRNLALPVLMDRKKLQLHRDEFTIERLEDRMVSVDDLVGQTSGYMRPTMQFDFATATCIQYRNSRVTEMFPHRIAVFYSLLSKWNQLSPAGIRLGLDRDDFGRFLIERPDSNRFATCSVQVNTVMDRKKEHPRPIFKQGFIGSCRYSFTADAPEDVRNAILLLSRFAELSGVGSSVARGCGQVNVTIQEGTNE